MLGIWHPFGTVITINGRMFTQLAIQRINSPSQNSGLDSRSIEKLEVFTAHSQACIIVSSILSTAGKHIGRKSRPRINLCVLRSRFLWVVIHCISELVSLNAPICGDVTVVVESRCLLFDQSPSSLSKCQSFAHGNLGCRS
jgi:hypothetical protein